MTGLGRLLAGARALLGSMAVLRRAGLVVAVALPIGVGVSAARASAVYGLLDHYEICTSAGDYASLTSVSVRQNVYVGARDDLVRVLTQGGTLIERIEGTGRPGENFRDPIVGTSGVGTLYVISDPLGSDPRLFKFSGGAFEREFPKDRGPMGLAPRLSNSVGLIAGRPARDGAAEEVFVADAEGIVSWDSNGNFGELYSGQMGKRIGRTVSISGTAVSPLPGVSGAVLALGRTSDSEAPSEVSLFVPRSDGIRFVNSFDAVPFLDGVAGAPDGTWWVLGGSAPGFHGLEHHSVGGALLDRVPIPGGLNALAVAPDGGVWVARSDGLLRLGQNGGPIPPDQFGHGKCGPPRVRASVPADQQIVRTRTLLVAASCNETCVVRASGTLSVPSGAARTFRLRPATRRLAAGRRGLLRLGLSRKAAAALSRAKARGRRSTATVTLSAADPGQTTSSRRLGLTIR